MFYHSSKIFSHLHYSFWFLRRKHLRFVCGKTPKSESGTTNIDEISYVFVTMVVLRTSSSDIRRFLLDEIFVSKTTSPSSFVRTYLILVFIIACLPVTVSNRFVTPFCGKVLFFDCFTVALCRDSTGKITSIDGKPELDNKVYFL